MNFSVKAQMMPLDESRVEHTMRDQLKPQRGLDSMECSELAVCPQGLIETNTWLPAEQGQHRERDTGPEFFRGSHRRGKA
jgi:hypothetical protein